MLAASIIGLAAPWRPAAADQPAKLRIRLGAADHFEPLTFRDTDGHPRGLLVDEIELVGQFADIDFEFVLLPWARAQQMVRDGSLDGFCTVDTPDRRDYTLFAPTALFDESVVVISRANDRRTDAVTRLPDLDGLRIGEPLGNSWFRVLLQDRKVTWANDIDNLLSMIAADRLDVTLIGKATASAILARHPARAALRARDLTDLPSLGGFYIGLRKSFPDVAAILAAIDGGIRAAAASFPAIRARYFTD